jgi:rhodanese-related sulfurtransferase
MGFLSNVFAKATSSSDAVEVAEAQRRQQAGALIVDVREPEEWREGHVAGAKHIPLGSLTTRLAELPRDQEILTFCRSGNRSARAQQLLQGQGCGTVRNVSGGIIATVWPPGWSRALTWQASLSLTSGR